MPNIRLKMYLLQDSRNFVGNNMLWWRADGRGYTTNVDEAERFTYEKAFKHYLTRRTDIPWEESYIIQKVRPTVDHQDVDRTEGSPI